MAFYMVQVEGVNIHTGRKKIEHVGKVFNSIDDAEKFGKMFRFNKNDIIKIIDTSGKVVKEVV